MVNSDFLITSSVLLPFSFFPRECSRMYGASLTICHIYIDTLSIYHIAFCCVDLKYIVVIFMIVSF